MQRVLLIPWWPSLWAVLCLVVSPVRLFVTTWAVTHQAPLSKITGVGCHALPQRIFPNQVSCIAGRFYHLSSQRSPLGTWQFNLAVYDYFISLDLSVKHPVRLMVLLACLLLNHHLDNTDLVNPLPVAATKVPVFTACHGHAFMEGPDDRTHLQVGRKGSSLGKKKCHISALFFLGVH